MFKPKCLRIGSPPKAGIELTLKLVNDYYLVSPEVGKSQHHKHIPLKAIYTP